MSDENPARRTFAIISHPDAGKTTLTERLLLYGGAIQLAGTVKARKARRHATSDWMALEQERGISVTSAVMQFDYAGRTVNLLDTPGHEDFSEDTYRTLTAVDSALMVIDAARGVEARTRKLMEICRLRNTPVMTFVNKIDRESRDPIDLLDEIEQVLGVRCAPITWPVGSGRALRGIYHLADDHLVRYTTGGGERARVADHVAGLDSEAMQQALGSDRDALRESIELVAGACDPFAREAFLAGSQTPVFFGSALNDLGVREMLDGFAEHAPGPLARATREREVRPEEPRFSGFVFKIQANMDPQHRDRIAFLRVTSGEYRRGMKLHHVRAGRDLNAVNAITFMARERSRTEEASAGDIIGILNHGTLRIGDTLTEGETLHFTGIPNFAPEIFRRVELRDPLRLKALQKGLDELSEEGATQVFRPLDSNDIILGAVGVLQFDVVAWRLRNEYKVESRYQPVQVATARWVGSGDARKLEEFTRRNAARLARDGAGELAYLAPTQVNLQLARERWPEIEFHATREH